MVQRAYRYRYPTPEQAHVPSRTFGCVRLVYNRALDARTAAWHADQRRISYAQTSAMLTAWKQTEEFAFLREASSIPLQQSLRHLQGAFVAFWEGRSRYPRFKSKKRDRRRDHSHKLTTRLVRENQTIVIEDLNVRGMIGNHALARGVNDAAWAELRRMLEYKCAWYGRELVVVDRWLPSSKICSRCGHLADRLPLSVRVWQCQSCRVWHDRDVNAANNLLAAGRAVTACGAGVRPQRESSRRGGGR
jgi:IS605 OrfB family transposase